MSGSFVNRNQLTSRVGDRYRVEKRDGKTYHVYDGGRAIRVTKRKTTMNDSGNPRQGMDYSVVRKGGATYHSYRGYGAGAVRVGGYPLKKQVVAAQKFVGRYADSSGPGLRKAKKK